MRLETSVGVQVQSGGGDRHIVVTLGVSHTVEPSGERQQGWCGEVVAMGQGRALLQESGAPGGRE